MERRSKEIDRPQQYPYRRTAAHRDQPARVSRQPAEPQWRRQV